MDTTAGEYDRPLMSVVDAGRLGSVSESTIRREIRSGRLRIVRLRNRTLIDPRDFEIWIESAKTGGVSDRGLRVHSVPFRSRRVRR